MPLAIRPSHIAGGLALILAMLAALLSTPGATAQTGDSSIEVHNRLCPTEYEGENWFEDCHSNVPDPGLPFTFSNDVTREGTTNEDGNVGFANLPAGTYTITGGVPGEFADHVVYCAIGTEAESNQDQIPVEYVTGGVQLDLPANTNVICDWYEIPYDLQGQTPTATAQPEMFDLPIYKLLCDSAPADTAATDFVMMGTMPDGCQQLGGVSVIVTAADDTVLGSCETQSTEPCYVTVPVGSTVYATEDPTTVPDGYVPVLGETIEYTIEPATEAWILFINVPAVQTPPPPTETPVDEAGRMVSIHEGNCTQEEPGTLVTELTDLQRPDTADDANVVIAETSSSVVSLTLDDLTGSEHALIAYSDDDTRTPVACTVLAGETNPNSELVLGLQEQNNSGYTGIVYLAPTGDGSETGVSVFLAEGLSEDSTPSTPAT